MADVQTGHGFTRVADSLLEALASARCTGTELRVMLAIIRLTYGYQRTDDVLPASQIAKMCGIQRRRVCDILTRLERRNMILRQSLGARKASRIGPNKDHDSWESKGAMLGPGEGHARPLPQALNLTPPEADLGPTCSLNLGPLSGHTKENRELQPLPSVGAGAEAPPAMPDVSGHVRRLKGQIPIGLNGETWPDAPAWFEAHREIMIGEAMSKCGEDSGKKFRGAFIAVLHRYWGHKTPIQRGRTAGVKREPVKAPGMTDWSLRDAKGNRI